MPKSATDVMQEAMLAAIVDAIVALKDASKGVPNALLRELNAVHANTTFADLPAPLQSAITANVRASFNRFLKEGYSVSPGTALPPRKPDIVRRDQSARTPPTGGPGGNRSAMPGLAPSSTPTRGARPRGKPAAGKK
jgi:hypothetical protein